MSEQTSGPVPAESCAWCRPPRPEDLDPNTTVFYCPKHQVEIDRITADLPRVVVPGPLSGSLGLPGRSYPAWAGAPTSPTIFDFAAREPAFSGITSDAPASWGAGEAVAAGSQLDTVLEFMRKWEGREPDRSASEIIAHEIRCAIVPMSVEQLAVRIADALRDRLLPVAESTTVEFEVRWHRGPGDAIALDESKIGTQARAEEIGAAKIGEFGITRFTVWRCEHRRYPDGSTWIGPWEPVAGGRAGQS